MDCSNFTIKIQRYCVDILSTFDSYAKDNHLTYYMAGGTLLGAVRHKGFIPWDDDVDIMMPREDYDELIKTWENDRYCLSSCERDVEYHTPFARLWDTSTSLRWTLVKEKEIGVFIDIFPIDGFPDGNIKTKLHLMRLKILRTKVNSAIRKDYVEGEKYIWMKNLLKLFVRKSGNYYARKLNAVAKKYQYSKCRYVGVKTTTGHLFREKNEKAQYNTVIYFPFETLKLPAPCGYDIYLKQLYGDYMQLPPIEERHSIHNFCIDLRGEVDRSSQCN